MAGVQRGLAGLLRFSGGLTPAVILAGVFLLGTGFAVQAPVASSSIPEIVGKEQLPSAIALGGIQMNLAGTIGPALGGLLVPFAGVSVVFAMNAMAFVIVLLAVSTWRRKKPEFNAPIERFFDSLAGAARYMRYAPGVQIILLRNFIFGVLIGAIPALLPVVGLKALHLDAVNLGLIFTSMGLGSLVGGVFILEPARKRLKPNQMTILGGIALAVVYALMAVVRHPQVFFLVAALAGVAWTISASELWVAGQRVIPDWIRGRMNATHMMVSQAGMSLAGLLWGVLATALDFKWVLFSASALGIASALTARRLSIDFSAEIDQEAHPLEQDGASALPAGERRRTDYHCARNRSRAGEPDPVLPARKRGQAGLSAQWRIQRPLGSGHGKPKSISFAGHTSLVGRAPATRSTNHAR